MVDWKGVIDRAISGRTIQNFVAYRAGRELDARGGSLKTPPELMDVDAMIEDFLLKESFTEIGIFEVSTLCGKLAEAIDPDEADPEKRRLMGLCFDALACIRELEARAVRERNARDMMHEEMAFSSHRPAK